MKNVIITGATSMIGTATVKEALKRDLSVTAVVRPGSPNIGILRSISSQNNLQITECDLCGLKSLSLKKKHDAFIHLAWQSTDPLSRDDVYTHINNVTYTIDAVNAAHRAGCSVFTDAGSQAEYGQTEEKMGSSTACNPVSAYGIAKYAAGKMAHLAASQLEMRSCHTRILSAYGEWLSDGSFITYLIRSLLSGEKPQLTKCGQMWDYIYSQDVAAALLSITENGIDGSIYPIGTGIARPLREYAEIIRDIINPGLELGFGEKEYYPHQTMYLCADISKLTSDTGFTPSVSFEDGIRETIKWVKARYSEV